MAKGATAKAGTGVGPKGELPQAMVKGKSGGSGGRSFGFADLVGGLGDPSMFNALMSAFLPTAGGMMADQGRVSDSIGRAMGGHSPVNDAVNQRMSRRMVGGGRGSVSKGGGGIAGIQGGDGNPDYNRRSTYAQIAEQNKYRTNDRAQNRLDMELEQSMKLNMLRKLLGLGGGRTSTETSMEDNWLQTAGNYENRPVKRTVTHDNTMDLLRMIL